MLSTPINYGSFPLNSPFLTQMEELKKKSTQQTVDWAGPVVISGASIAGLTSAIQLTLMGVKDIYVLEKRSLLDPMRRQIVAIEALALQELKEIGVYCWLKEQKLINAPHPHVVYSKSKAIIQVRIQDLELALREVFARLTNNKGIYFDASIQKVSISEDAKTTILQVKQGDTNVQLHPDVVIIAEGKNSSTNELLGLSRKQVLKDIQGFSAISVANNKKTSCIKKFGSTLANIAITIYYFVIYVFYKIATLFCHISVLRGMVLHAANQNYIGVIPGKSQAKKIQNLNEKIQSLSLQLEHVNGKEKAKIQKQIGQYKAKKQKHIRFWASVAYWDYTLKALITKIVTCGKAKLPMYSFKRIDKNQCFDFMFSADCLQKTYEIKGSTAFIPIGDAQSTVDPITGLGCSKAIHDTKRIKELFESIWKSLSWDPLADFGSKMQASVNEYYEESKKVRRRFRIN